VVDTVGTVGTGAGEEEDTMGTLEDTLAGGITEVFTGAITHFFGEVRSWGGPMPIMGGGLM
jgi:hypothetical protein